MPGATLDGILMPGRGYREAIVQAAASQLGAKDHRVSDYWRAALGLGDTSPGPFPPQWCGAFDLWCLKQAGLCVGINWQIGRGFLLCGPCPLAIALAPQPGDTSYKGSPFQHHAVVESVDPDGTVHTIDGNQGPPSFIKRASHKLGDGAHTYFSVSALIDRAIAALPVAA